MATKTPDLFSEFARLWVALCPADALKHDAPLPFTVAGQRVVLFRDDHGVAQALIDRCPHRGVALSLGQVTGGEIACPFHGWRFNGAGRCTHVPWNPQARLGALSATALPCVEAGGLLWLYTASEARGGPALPDALTRPGLRLTAQSMVWDVHWTRVMENMLDTPHLPFVHARTIGKRLQGCTDQPMEMHWEETPTGAAITARRNGEAPRSTLLYHFPNMMELAIDPPGKVLRLFAVCTPEAAGKTRLTICTLRSFAKWRGLDWLFARMNARIAAEDKAIVESSLPAEVPEPGAERSVASDVPTLAFRKIWHTRIKQGR